MTLYCS